MRDDDGRTPAGGSPGRLELRPVPLLERPDGSALTNALPLLGTLGTVGVFATMSGSDGGRQLVLGAVFLLAGLAYVAVQVDRQRLQRSRTVQGRRRDYLHHLAAVRSTLTAAESVQRATALTAFPRPPGVPGARTEDGGLTVRYGTGPAAADLVPVRPEPQPEEDPVAAAAADRLVAARARVPDLPATVDLTDVRVLSGAGADVARALVCSAAGRHPPDRLAVAVLGTPERLERWEWVKWLPHASGPASDAVGPRRLVGSDLGRLPDDRHVLLVVDGRAAPPPHECVTVLVVGDTGLLRADGLPLPGLPDRCSVPGAEALARRLARAPAASAGFDATPRWAPRPPGERLRVTLGTDDRGRPVHLDLKEGAAGGVGPHGLLVGATGSGKSELLRSLVLRLALDHPPDDLNLVLVDFKGGATFAGLADVPHVSALVTNLAAEAALVERMEDALAGELLRRQEHLREAGATSAAERGDGLPTLLVVVDEFAELLDARPGLLDLFVTLGRLGRSLGIHLLLASQRLDEGRLRGLDAHLSYRIGLRTFSAAESRAAIGVPDAAELPPRPGVGYLRTGPATLVRFRAPYVSAPRPHTATLGRVLPFTAAVVPGPAPATRPGPSVLDEAVAAMAGHGRSARQIWLPPLTGPIALGPLLTGRRERLVAPVGLVDRPRDQRHDPLELDLGAGLVAAVGGPRSGKTTLLRTVAAAVALTHPPDEVQLFLLDPGDGLSPLAALPHVSVHATEAETMRRAGDELRRLLDGRGRGRPDDYGDVVVLVDGWGSLQQEYDDLLATLTTIADRGPGLGLHLVVATTRWSDLRARVRGLAAARLELRLGDPTESEIDRRRAAQVPARPGRGLVPAGHFLAAVPALDETGGSDGSDGSDGMTAVGGLVAEAQRRWPGARGPRVRTLPATVDLAELAAAPGLRFGLGERDLAPVALALGEQLLVLGDSGSGKTTLLRALVREAVARPAGELQVVLVDYHRRWRGEVPAGHLLAHLTSAVEARPALAALAQRLSARLASTSASTSADTSASASPDSPVARPQVLLVVDDHHLVAGAADCPLRVLLPLLPRAREVGLTVAVARRAAGAGRALYDPVLLTIRELGASGVLLAGSPEEGPLLGGLRPGPAAPGRGRLVRPGLPPEAVQVAWTSALPGSIQPL